MELGTLSLTELRRLQSRVEAEIRRRSDSARRDLLKKMQKMAADEGLSLSDLIGSAPVPATEKKPAAKRGRAAAGKKKEAPTVKYRHPETPGVGWSGRGRKPQWALDWIAQGKSIEELAV
ncbi:putative trans-acting regulatory protein HvrA [Azoarcus olearius]|uniref:Trans-acting regulatory protein HvrA n=2 Tax=Azoarcus sp. (strain BH72) TaxID=418699 RepID=A1KAI1_AZOSB|nr:H-NS histone family protein [Azoarcus olearius]CAL95837.1 putative trans-acting regulatory protein HvrA [Azoarcus olearius]